jgi:hypothetical protein
MKAALQTSVLLIVCLSAKGTRQAAPNHAAMSKPTKQRKSTVKTRTRAPREDVPIHVRHDMTTQEMQLVLSRIYAIATLDPELMEFAASLENSLRKLITARIARDGVGSPDPIH